MAIHSNSNTIKTKIITIFTFGFCLLFSVLPVIRSGLKYDFGIGFWGPTAHDFLWHLSLINHIKNPFSIPFPSFSGELLTNYHPFFNILLALIPIDHSFLLFQVFPLVSSLVILILVYKISYQFYQKHTVSLLTIFFYTFSNSLGWIYTYLTQRKIAGESLFWSMQSLSSQINPPFILSQIFILLIIYLLQTKPKSIIIPLLLIFLPITKVYGAITGYALVFFYWFFNYQEITKKIILNYFISFLLAILLFFKFNASSSSLLIFNPFWFIFGMFSSTDKLYIPKVASFLFNTSLSDPRKIFILFIGIIIFYLGNFSFRLLAFKYLSKFNKIQKIIFLVTIISALIPLFFIQKSTAWNTIQFLYYPLALSNLLFSSYIFHQLNNRLYLSVFLILYFSFISNLDLIKGSLGSPPPSAILSSEYQAIQFLNSQSPGIILTYPYDPHLLKNQKTPIPLYAYETTSYLPAYTHHLTYLSDEMNAGNSNKNWQQRKNDSLKFFDQKSNYEDRGFLVNNQIDYIYLVDQQVNKTSLKISDMSLSKIYDNSYVQIYKVNR
ncbi:MAG TPA: hypothetical protein PK370_00305 [Candidatus Woesebacteria bacterium]|nr:hypothetical protein [Candidatus Woesebacteria bacterium]